MLLFCQLQLIQAFSKFRIQQTFDILIQTQQIFLQSINLIEKNMSNFTNSEQKWCEEQINSQVISNFESMENQDSQDLFTKLVNSTSTNECIEKFILTDSNDSSSFLYLQNNIFQNKQTFFTEPQLASNTRDQDAHDKKIKNSQETKETDRREPKKNNYKTKNFLAKFKNPLLDYLRKKLGKNYEKYPQLQEYKKKSYLSMKDFQNIFTQSSFHDILQKMFEEKVFYRALVISNTEMQSKKYFIQKIEVFQEAFESRNFTKIN